MAEPDRRAAEAWFVAHGLPYFVDDIRASVHAGLSRGRLVLVLCVAVLVGGAVGVAAGLSLLSVSSGVALGLQTALGVLVVYALIALQTWSIAAWAARRTFSSLGLLFPLVTRALPLLLLFVTFLFINAEVWQVAAGLDGGVMVLTVALFFFIAVGFLLVRLPEELAVFDDSDESDEQLAGLQKANLVLMLLITQLVQVLLLSLSVFVFFVAFGLLVMDPEVILQWTGQKQLQAMPFFERANLELIQVSVFLAAFSGLYFTVYAITDETYRKEFFTSIIRELERAVTARAAYRGLRQTEP